MAICRGTIECILTVFEVAGMTETINTAQLTMALQEQILMVQVQFLSIVDVIVGGWCQA